MQLVSFRIWTRVTVSISNDDNHYTTGTSKYTTGTSKRNHVISVVETKKCLIEGVLKIFLLLLNFFHAKIVAFLYEHILEFF